MKEVAKFNKIGYTHTGNRKCDRRSDLTWQHDDTITSNQDQTVLMGSKEWVRQHEKMTIDQSFTYV